ncbi:MAG: VanZ family protein [Bacteroidales bacterium]|nr:VanZ family protein [Bacteroidales bacterium]
MTTAKSILSRLLFLLYLAAVATLCFISSDKFPTIQKTIWGIATDKLAHFAMFLPFPILLYLAWDHRSSKPSGAIGFAVLNFAAGTLIAALTEWIQKFLPTRCMDLHDFNSDLLALGVATVLVFIIDITHLKSRRNV